VSEPSPKRPRPSRATLRRLIGLGRSELRTLLLGTFFLIVGSLMSLLYPLGVKTVIDGALHGVRPEVIDHAAIAMALISLVFGVSIAARFVLFGVAGERVVKRLRERLYGKVLEQEIGFFDQRRTGELTSTLNTDTAVLQNAVSVNLSLLLRSVAQVVGGIGFLVFLSLRLSALMLAVVPAVALGAVIYGRRVRRLAREVQDALAAASGNAEESIAGIRTVRAFTAEPAEASRYAVGMDRALHLARKRIMAGGSFMAVASFAAYAAAAVVFWYGARMVRDGRLSTGELTSFLIYTLIVAFAMGGLADLWADFMRASGSAERVFELLDRQPAIPPSGGAIPTHIEGAVSLSAVHFAYPTRPDVPVLNGIDIDLAPGEVVALVGPSGAGKSTVASLLMRFYDPQQGKVTVDGRDVRSLDPRWLRQHVGTVAQEPILFSTSIADNIRYGRPEAPVAEIEAAARAANAHPFISQFPDGYATLVGERGVQLSGGQKQRVAIARALLKDPRILVLDEATSALDAESEHLVREALERLMSGRTTLIIAHRLSTVMGADRVLVLDGGQVVQSGPHARLVTEDGLYRRLVERQFVVG
jgi:ABC transporter fused permease/ATP-binding protein